MAYGSSAPGAVLFPQYIRDDFLASTSASCNFLKEILKNITHSARRHGYSDHAGDGAQPAT
jgi:hypothetical protein